jgi:serine/threonine protein phosphatase PrpC
MELLTIGAFAKASRLSPKALRLYDELGLLTPARVDPVSGYRLYDPAQLERARLVAWLRRLGMPLARIRAVFDVPAEEAARQVRAFWDGVEAETAERRELAGFLIDHLSWKEPTVPGKFEIRYAALSENGLVRESNQDAAYAGSRVLAVADGFGARGASASNAAIEALKNVESLAAGDLLNVLDEAVEQAGEAVTGVTGTAESGTTLTAMLWTGSRLALVHIGDSRAYLLRGGEIFQITTDHTMVQAMVDDGRLTPEEATSHPQRALLLKALWGKGEARPDVRLHDAEAGDRYLLCSDGLSAVVPPEEVRRVVTTVAEPEDAVRELVDLAIAAGGPDNVSCVVADVSPADQ